MTHPADTDLLALARDGDLGALRTLVDRHLHPAWRIATVAAADPDRAAEATVEGVVAGLLAAERQAVDVVGLRVRLVGATRHAASTTGSGAAPGALPAADDPVVAAFLALPEKSRTALWLTEVEGGAPEQVAPVLGLDRSAAAALADRAAMALRERLAADVATRATTDACRAALAKLPAHAAGKLTAAERAAVGEHVGGCGTCAVWLAALVAPRPALRRLVADPPADALAAAIEARWLEHLDRARGGRLLPVTERAVGAAAAAVLAVGLGGVAFLGSRDDREADRRSEVAVPAGADPDPATTAPPDGTGPVAAPATVPGAGGSSARQAGSPGGAATDRQGAPGTADRSRPTEAPTPPTAPTTTAPSLPAPAPPPPIPDRPATDDGGLQVAVALLDGAVALGLGDCTGLGVAGIELGCVPPSPAGPLSITIDLPGLDPIGI